MREFAVYDVCLDCTEAVEYPNQYPDRRLPLISEEHRAWLSVGEYAGIGKSACEACGSRLLGDRYSVVAVPPSNVSANHGDGHISKEGITNENKTEK